jgi:hypothetical protein
MKILEKNCRLILLQYIIGTVVKINVRKAGDKRDGRNCTAEGLLSYGQRYGVRENYGENSRKEL